MAQTARSFAALETLLATNGAKDISATALRDFLESAMGCYGSMYVDGGTTAAAIGAAFALLVPPWLVGGTCRNTTANLAASKLEVDADGIYAISFAATALVTGATDRFAFEVRNLGVKVAGLTAEITGTLGERVGAQIGPRAVSLTAGDEISIYAKAVGGVGDLTIEHAQLALDRVG